MRKPADLKKEIEKRVRNYLKRDTCGIRHELLSIFTRMKEVTIDQVHQSLTSKFEVSYQSVASMVGIITSRLGILTSHRKRDNDRTTYELKPQYADLVARLLHTAHNKTTIT